MTTQSEIIAEVSKLDSVYSAKAFGDKRVYVNIVGYNRSFAGDRNAKVFWDTKLGWRIEGLKGNMSHEFARNIRAFADAYYPRAFTV